MQAIYAETTVGNREAYIIIKADDGTFYRVIGKPERLNPSQADTSAIAGFDHDMEKAGVSDADRHEILYQLGH